MDSYCVLGNPVDHSKSPWIHARFAELTGESLTYGRRLAPLDGFEATVAAFRAEGGKGCNITLPFKFDAARLATRLSPRAQLAQAANTLRFDGDEVFGDNTDGAGLVADIQRNAAMLLSHREVLLVGAGGAAAGVLGPLIEVGPARITVANRTPEKAQALVERHRELARANGVALAACALDELHSAYDVVINASASSLSGGAVPVAASVLKRGALAYDMMYGRGAEGFLQWARANGAVGRDGLGMLVEQAAEAFLMWRGVRPPSGQVLDELRAAVA